MINLMNVKMKTDELDKKRKKVKNEEEELKGNVIWEERTNKRIEELYQKRKKFDNVIEELIETVKIWEEKMNKKEEEFNERKKVFGRSGRDNERDEVKCG